MRRTISAAAAAACAAPTCDGSGTTGRTPRERAPRASLAPGCEPAKRRARGRVGSPRGEAPRIKLRLLSYTRHGQTQEIRGEIALRPRRGRGTDAGGAPPGDEAVALHEAAQTRYLNYALSVITSRALPDVRDGLKPVQRRILYTMWQQNLTADAKHRKCAKVVGDVMGNYHPHGDSALYETLVRMAQPFSLRYPLVDGSGNFGSLDGDNAAAMRYTECRLARLSDEMLAEIDQDDGAVPAELRRHARRSRSSCPRASRTCWSTARPASPSAWRRTSRRTTSREVCTALVKLLDNPDLTSVQLCRYVKGPDFPTGGQMLNSADELKEIYKTGSGAIRLRAHLGGGAGDPRRRRPSTSRAFPTPSTRRRSSSGSPTSRSAASCRRSWT